MVVAAYDNAVQHALSSLKFLVIVDSPVEAESIEHHLRAGFSEPIEFKQVSDHEAALEAIASSDPIDCIIADGAVIPQRDNFQQDITDIASQDRTAPIPVIYLCDDGQPLPVSNGSDKAFLGLAKSDMTSTVLHFAAAHLLHIAATRKSADEERRSQTEFLSLAVHDLKAPARQTATFLTFLREDLAQIDDPRIKETIERLEGISKDMTKLIESFHLYCTIDRVLGNKGTVDLKEAVDNARVRLAAGAPTKEIKVVSHGALPTISCYTGGITKLFDILFDNAVNFNNCDQRLIEVQAKVENDICEISVQDNGIGIPADSVAEIFKPFKRLHPKSRYPGMGLGLAIANRIVQSHGGVLTVSANPDGGSIFTVRLPQHN